VLFNQRGSVKAREMVGIMGPTGSGKTSLLNVLSMRTGLSQGSTFKGSLKVDGIELKNRNEF
jgi:ABC-type lipoprotein export system ATPase subunit